LPDIVPNWTSQFVISIVLHFIQADDFYLLIPVDFPGTRPGTFIGADPVMPRHVLNGPKIISLEPSGDHVLTDMTAAEDFMIIYFYASTAKAGSNDHIMPDKIDYLLPKVNICYYVNYT
jgi:hypothetical protein